MKRPDYIPADYDRIVVVDRLNHVFKTAMAGQINCVAHFRRARGDFDGLAETLFHRLGPTNMGHDMARIVKMQQEHILSPEQDRAITQIIHEMQTAKAAGYIPNLRVLGAEGYGLNTLVHCFHEDGCVDDARADGRDSDRVIATYGLRRFTIALRNDDDIIRAHHFSGETCYMTGPHAKPFPMRNAIWRQKCLSMRVPRGEAFIHRAPDAGPGSAGLLMVANMRA